MTSLTSVNKWFWIFFASLFIISFSLIIFLAFYHVQNKMAVIIIKNSNNELELLTVDKHILDFENGEAINFFKGNTKYEVVFKKYIFDGNTYKIVLYDTNQKFFHDIKPGDKLFHFYGSQSMFSWLFNIKN